MFIYEGTDYLLVPQFSNSQQDKLVTKFVIELGKFTVGECDCYPARWLIVVTLFFDIFERRERDHCALNKVEKMCSAHFVDNNDLIFELVMKKQIFLSRLLAQKNITSLTFFKVFASLESRVCRDWEKWKTRTPTGCTVQCTGCASGCLQSRVKDRKTTPPLPVSKAKKFFTVWR